MTSARIPLSWLALLLIASVLFLVQSFAPGTASAAVRSAAAHHRATAAVTRAVGSPALTDAEAASHVRRSSWEPRAQNYTANHRAPTGAELAVFHVAQANLDEWNVNPYAQQVTGDFTGTTDEIIQWAAWKWGIDEDVLRAVATAESWWKQDGVGQDGRYYSYGIMQVLNAYAGTDPLARVSTAFNVDFYAAQLRFVFDGKNRWFNDVAHGQTYGPGDVWGSVASWYAGAWWTDPAVGYIDTVKGYLATRDWEQPGF